MAFPRAIVAACALHAAAVVALAVAAVALLRTYCESFGCIGLGIAWMMWVGGFAVALALGAGVRWRSAALSRPRRVAQAALALQLAMGTTLLVVWLLRTH